MGRGEGEEELSCKERLSKAPRLMEVWKYVRWYKIHKWIDTGFLRLDDLKHGHGLIKSKRRDLFPQMIERVWNFLSQRLWMFSEQLFKIEIKRYLNTKVIRGYGDQQESGLKANAGKWD